MNRGGFSWKRAVGISAAKARFLRSIGIPGGRVVFGTVVVEGGGRN
jgi:hypothetical protein